MGPEERQAIRERYATMRQAHDDGDEAEFSLAAAEAIDDVPALLDALAVEETTTLATHFTGVRNVRLSPEQVVYSYLRPTMVHGDFQESLLDLLEHDRRHARRIVGRLGFRSSANLASGRNTIVKTFLEAHTAPWLLMLDTDMVFAPDSLESLIQHADAERAPIVGGLCFGFDENGDIQPTLFGLEPDPEAPDDPSRLQVTRYHDWKPEAMYPVAGTGAAFLLMHRTALEKIRNARFNTAFPWFQELEHGGRAVGEDLGFCFRAIQCDLPVYVNTAVQVGHVKERVLTAETFYLSRGLLSPVHPGAAV